jgi:hypothetical protein
MKHLDRAPLFVVFLAYRRPGASRDFRVPAMFSVAVHP